jgi:predicted NAD/FAD-binding protein
MNDRIISPVLSVDKLKDGVLVTFKDGECAVYSHILLYTLLPQAQRVESDPTLETDD